MKIREIDIPDNRPFIVRVAELKPSKDFNPPNTLGKPKGKSVAAKRVLAMDACIKNVLSGFRNELNTCGVPMFAGYGLLSSISQEALVRAGVETIADEMTRKFVKFRYDVDDGKKNHEQELSEIEQEAEKYKVKERFNEAAQKDGYFGGCLVYIDVGELDNEEAEEPLVLDTKTFKKGMLKGFKVIEPINIYPGEYNTTDPTDEHYFNPEYWYVLGKRYHASRFLYFAGNSVPILLKPAYNFFGIARAQLALDYIAHFVENRESAQELLNKFSLTCWKTDMTQVLAGESCNDLVKRVRMFNKMKSNNGTLVVDKEQEDIMQINTPLGGVRDIVEMSLNLLTAVWRIPKIKYIGEGEGGLNASSKEQMRSFYDFILSQKEKMFTQPMETVLKILQLNMGKDINESIGFEFPSLVEMDDSEIASLNKLKADTAVSLINAGVVSQEEVRQNLSMDKNSGFSMIDVDDIPEQPEQPNEKEIVDVEDEDLVTDERWITVKNNHDNPEEKGRHLLLEGEGENQETPAEAMKRQWKFDITKKDNKKEEKEFRTNNGESENKNVSEMTFPELLNEENDLREKEFELIKKRDDIFDYDKNLLAMKQKKQDILNATWGIKDPDVKKSFEKQLSELDEKIGKREEELKKQFNQKELDNVRERISEIAEEKDKKTKQTREDADREYAKYDKEKLEEELDFYRQKRNQLYNDIENSINFDPRVQKIREDIRKLKEERSKISSYNSTVEEMNRSYKLQDEISSLAREEEKIVKKYNADAGYKKMNYYQREAAINERLGEIRKKEREEETKQKAERGKALAKDNYYPKTIAGVSRGKEMSVEEADSGNPNPKFNSGESGYGINCQSCVVCYEARLRGYDVTTKPNKRGSKLATLSHGTNQAWIDPETGLEPEFIRPDTIVKNSAKYYKFLEDTIEKGKRYNLGFAWKGRGRTGHIVSISRNNNGLEIYDPQSGRKYAGDELKNYLGKISYKTTIRSVQAGPSSRQVKEVSSVELLRVDNLAFNPEFMNDIMERK